MRRSTLLSAAIVFSLQSVAQSVAINTDKSAADASALLDVKSSNKGLLIPRTSTTSRLAIVKPAKGLLLYDTTSSSFWFYNSSAWVQLSSGGSGWNLTGNSGTNPASNFLGTTDAQPLRFRVGNAKAGELHPTSGNVYMGVGAGQSTTTGESNDAIGEHSLFANTEGNFNVANGYYALAANTNGYSNTALGAYALTNNLTGFNNTAVGRNALFANNEGSSNTAVGKDALLSNNSGGLNTAVGYQSVFSNTSGVENTGIGYQALYANTIGNKNVAIGVVALGSNTIGDNNTAIGNGALYANVSGIANTATGRQSLYLNYTGSGNTANGCQALYANYTGSENTAVGYAALTLNSVGAGNTATGYAALFSNTGNNNTANGYKALYLSKNENYNTALGYQALLSSTSGTQTTAVGSNALYQAVSSFNSTAVGFYALQSDVSGQFNIGIGAYSGTGGPNGGNLNNTIGIGNTGNFLNGASNQAIIGNESMYFIGGKVNWGTVSDARIKNNIAEDVKGLDFILRLRPVTYHISNRLMNKITGAKETPDFPGKYDVEQIKYSGFLAQEVEQAAKASNYEFSGYDAPKNASQLYTLKYAEFVVPLVKAVQEQQKTIADLTLQVQQNNATPAAKSQQQIIEQLQQQVAALEQKVNALELKK